MLLAAANSCGFLLPCSPGQSSRAGVPMPAISPAQWEGRTGPAAGLAPCRSYAFIRAW